MRDAAPNGSGRKPLAAARAARGKDLAATRGRHTRPETVAAFANKSGRLIGTFHRFFRREGRSSSWFFRLGTQSPGRTQYDCAAGDVPERCGLMIHGARQVNAGTGVVFIISIDHGGVRNAAAIITVGGFNVL
jgi:hypothetical protein